MEKYCISCGYVLNGLPHPRCPECGRGFHLEDRTSYATGVRSGSSHLHFTLFMAVVMMLGVGVFVVGSATTQTHQSQIIDIIGFIGAGAWMSLFPAFAIGVKELCRKAPPLRKRVQLIVATLISGVLSVGMILFAGISLILAVL